MCSETQYHTHSSGLLFTAAPVGSVWATDGCCAGLGRQTCGEWQCRWFNVTAATWTSLSRYTHKHTTASSRGQTHQNTVPAAISSVKISRHSPGIFIYLFLFIYFYFLWNSTLRWERGPHGRRWNRSLSIIIKINVNSLLLWRKDRFLVLSESWKMWVQVICKKRLD